MSILVKAIDLRSRPIMQIYYVFHKHLYNF